MNLARLYKRCLFATVIVAVSAYAYAEQSVSVFSQSGGGGFTLLALPVIALGWWLTEGRAQFRWPTWMTYLAVAAIVIRGVMRALSEGVDIAVFCEFLTLVLVYKVWDHHRTRDQGQILTLCAFLAIGAILTGTSLVLGLLLMLLVPLLLASVMMFQLRPDDKLALPPRAIAAEASRGGRLPRIFGVALLILWAGSIGIFVYFPREIGFGAFGRWGQGLLTTGFTDRVELGRAGLLSESLETVLELELRDGLGNARGGPAEVYYLRGAVQDEYRRDTGAWVRSEGNRGGQRMSESVVRGFDLDSQSDRDTMPRDLLLQTITLRDGGAGPLFAAWRPFRVNIETRGQPIRVNWRPADRAMQRSQFQGPIRYTVTSSVRPIPSQVEDLNREVSFDSQIVRDLATQILSSRGIELNPAVRVVADHARAADAIEDYLRTNFSYTLNIEAPPPGRDPIDWFLDTHRQGHCEYFASAMAALCRSVGIDARVVTGYVAAEWDDVTRKYTVRESNAHAWVEARVERGVWRTFDPTPPADLVRVHQPPMDIASRLRRLLDSAENSWAINVVGYDESVRRNLIGADTPVISWIEYKMRAVALARSADRAKSAMSDVRRAVRWGIGIVVAMVVGWFAIRYAWRRWKQRRRRIRAPGSRARFDPSLSFYPQLLRTLDRRGLGKPESLPPLLHADALAAQDPALSRAVSRVAATYYKAAFGGEPLTEVERREAEDLVRELAQPAARNGSSAHPSHG